MTEAYDKKVLLENLKARGLDIAEEGAVILIEETIEWFKVSAPLSKTPWDDMFLIVADPLKKIAIDQADKIDGEDDRP